MNLIIFTADKLPNVIKRNNIVSDGTVTTPGTPCDEVGSNKMRQGVTTRQPKEMSGAGTSGIRRW